MAGQKRLDKLKYQRVRLDSSWDGLWRIVIFDIPEYSNKDRDRIRRLIKQLGFMHLQHSVWIHPMPCIDEIRQIQEVYGSSTELIYFETSKMETSKDIEKEYRMMK